ncbi:RNA polymerase recycling motor HelD [Alkalihalobacillus pseudalcaliphilus]|uniref:RNA polymerase recycling motor HelD n=1 Tax=Alkalihalobacillus pseudalcaliphilus TaxID=79884 RepID=UPI00064E0C2A|nr:RNA polymerase recycling motor HelD [Alkalihalobacillus pseudalcaliphilus]KMK74410.1 helicase [Alkalihalobacillus pseudalcaliphilus]
MELEIQQEQKRLELVLDVIEAETKKLSNETAKRKNEVVQTRKHFWDEVKVNTDTFDDYLETIIGLRQEAQALSVSQSTHQHTSKRLSTLHRMEQVPYFGRIDFTEEGSHHSEPIYIGLSSLTDKSGEEFLIYDWRAPISSVYYDFQPGPAQYETPSGRMNGQLENKFQYLVRKGKIESMFDTSLTIGDEILQQVLGQSTNKHMQSIVATIQQEQNRIIRHDKGRLLIVHGAAGSGKTSAALQRIAYLLYKYREQINADQIILFSPNTMFSSYVSNVLPELGEENMQQVTFQQYLQYRLGDLFQVENPYEQLEYVLTATKNRLYHSRIASIRFKASTEFFKAMQSYRQSLAVDGMIFTDIPFRGQTIITAEKLTKRFYSIDSSLSFHNRLEKLRDWLLKELSSFHKRERGKPWVQEEIELLSNEQYHKARIFLAKKRGYERADISDYEVEPEALAHLIVRKKIKPLREYVQSYQFVDFKAIYQQLFSISTPIHQWLTSEKPSLWEAICETTSQALKENILYYEDATPFLLLKEMIQGFQTNRSIKQIVIDEAQDYSPFQFEFLKRLFPVARMTVLGDFNQAIFAHAHEQDNFNTLTSLYGAEQTEMIELTRSYRSTKPIIDFTSRLVANGQNIVPFNRDGVKPQLTFISSRDELHQAITAQVTEWQEQGYQSIAIVCKSAAESFAAFSSLSDINDLKLLKSTSLEYEQGVVVVPSYVSKGIEFDAVIIYDASADVYEEESLRRIFYTVCTRAMHQLQLFSIGRPTSFLDHPLINEMIEAKHLHR